jgi:hypothetical protein
VKWIHVAQDRTQCWAVVNVVEPWGSIKDREFLTS